MAGLVPTRDGSQYYVNFQPVIPFTLNDDWNLIVRTIVPIVYQNDVFPDAGSQFGFGDTLQSYFFSPSQTVHGFTWGVGPALNIPTGSGPLLSSEKVSVGPTAVALWQGSGWTIGALANHLWSVTGPDDRARCQFHLHPALCGLHDEGCLDVLAEHRVDLQLGDQRLVGPDHAEIPKDREIGQAADPAFRWRSIMATSPMMSAQPDGARAGDDDPLAEVTRSSPSEPSLLRRRPKRPHPAVPSPSSALPNAKAHGARRNHGRVR